MAHFLFYTVHAFLLGFIFVYLNSRRGKYDVSDLLVVGWLSNYSLYSIIDVSLRGPNQLQADNYYAPLAYSFASLCAFLLMFRALPEVVRLKMRISNYIALCGGLKTTHVVSFGYIGVAYLLAIIVQYGYGVVLNPGSDERLLEGVPSWVIQSLGFAFLFFYSSAFVLLASLLKNAKKVPAPGYILIALALLMILASGRRALFAIAVLMYFVYLEVYGKSFINRQTVLLALVLALLGVLFSNVFQTYRFYVAGIFLGVNEVVPPLSEALFNFSATVYNLTVRDPNYIFEGLISRSLSDGRSPMYGSVLSQAFENSLPSLLIEKSFILIDDVISLYYGLEIKDWPLSYISGTLADFGYFGFVFYGMLMLMFVVPFVLTSVDFLGGGVSVMLYYTLCLTLINIETAYGNIFLSYRNYIILMILFLVFSCFRVVYLAVLHHLSAKRGVQPNE